MKGTGMIRTVLFDLDGTLIDTEKYYRICWRQALKDFGYEMTDEQALSMRSLGRPFAPARLKELFGEEIDYYAVRDRRKELMNACIEAHGIAVKPGAVRLLEYLRAHRIPAAVATATDPVRTKKYLDDTGLAGYFDAVISATMVKEGKPSPDIYLYACKQLGEKPEHCLAVEDSPNGVMSAWRAGCKVVMVPDQTQPDEALHQKLYAKADTLEDVIPLLGI